MFLSPSQLGARAPALRARSRPFSGPLDVQDLPPDQADDHRRDRVGEEEHHAEELPARSALVHEEGDHHGQEDPDRQGHRDLQGVQECLVHHGIAEHPGEVGQAHVVRLGARPLAQAVQHTEDQRVVLQRQDEQDARDDEQRPPQVVAAALGTHRSPSPRRSSWGAVALCRIFPPLFSPLRIAPGRGSGCTSPRLARQRCTRMSPVSGGPTSASRPATARGHPGAASPTPRR